jgi:hypothetical protein
MLKKAILLSSVVILSACNESDSHDIDSGKLVLDAVLYVENNTAKMIADISKEKSHVTIVLNGGDFLQATNGKETKVMEYQSDTFWGSSYRATFPLNTSNTHKIIFNRAAQNQKFDNVFPAIPVAFNFVYPIPQQTFSVAANKTINIQWDSKVNSDQLLLRGHYTCAWAANPAVFDVQAQKTLTEVTNSRGIDITLSPQEKDLRTRALHVQEAVQSMSKELQAHYPNTTLTFNGCDVDLELTAKNVAAAHAEFSGKSSLQSYRKVGIETTLTP